MSEQLYSQEPADDAAETRIRRVGAGVTFANSVLMYIKPGRVQKLAQENNKYAGEVLAAHGYPARPFTPGEHTQILSPDTAPPAFGAGAPASIAHESLRQPDQVYEALVGAVDAIYNQGDERAIAQNNPVSVQAEENPADLARRVVDDAFRAQDVEALAANDPMPIGEGWNVPQARPMGNNREMTNA